jgi:hypothetical protein
MAFIFSIEKESLKRKFAVYVVIAKADVDVRLYVGKTGDNRDGCNPLISRCGNHFSYNEVHSQVRNKLDGHEERDYTYVFDHFDEYTADKALRQKRVACINEMERWLNEEIQAMCSEFDSVHLLNPYTGVSFVRQEERMKRRTFRTGENREKINGIVAAVRTTIAVNPSNGIYPNMALRNPDVSVQT